MPVFPFKYCLDAKPALESSTLLAQGHKNVVNALDNKNILPGQEGSVQYVCLSHMPKQNTRALLFSISLDPLGAPFLFFFLSPRR